MNIESVPNRLRKMADWFESNEGIEWAADKRITDFGLRRSVIIDLLHDQNKLKEQDKSNVSGENLLNSAIICYWGETIFRTPIINKLLKIALKG
jgi:hypothetical protein